MAMTDALSDARHSFRMLWRSAGFTFAALAALAVGIGANTAIFSIVNAVLLKPVPFPEPERMLVFQTTSQRGAFSAGSPAKFQHWLEQASVVQDVAAYRSNVVNFTGGGFPEQLRASQVSATSSACSARPSFAAAPSPRTKTSRVATAWRCSARPSGTGASRATRTSSARRSPWAASPYTIVGVLGAFDFEDLGPPPAGLDPLPARPEHSTTRAITSGRPAG